MTGVTSDSIAMRGAGIVRITQPAKGHRFTLDSLLLADFCRIRPGDRVLEPGAGTGIVSLLLARKHPRAAFSLVELQPALVPLCEQNIADNGLSARITVLRRDLRRIGRRIAPASMSVVVANPPYIKAGTGRPSPEHSRRDSRQDGAASLGSWLNLQRYLKNGGRYVVIFPAGRLAELCAHLRARRFEPKRLRLVHPFADRPASLVLMDAVKEGGAGVEVLPPLIVHERGGGYSTEIRDLYGLPAGA